VIEPDKDGNPRAHARPVESGPMIGDEIVVQEGLSAGEQVAASGSFKLREAARVAIAKEPTPDAGHSK
jgi:membrane fusion protein (multidrug efflux system)